MSKNKGLNKTFNVSTEANTSPLPAKSIRFMDGCPRPIVAKRANSNNTKSNSTQGQKSSDEKSKDK